MFKIVIALIISLILSSPVIAGNTQMQGTVHMDSETAGAQNASSDAEGFTSTGPTRINVKSPRKKSLFAKLGAATAGALDLAAAAASAAGNGTTLASLVYSSSNVSPLAAAVCVPHRSDFVRGATYRPSCIGLAHNSATHVVQYVDPSSEALGVVYPQDTLISIDGMDPTVYSHSPQLYQDENTAALVIWLTPYGEVKRAYFHRHPADAMSAEYWRWAGR